MRRLIIFLLLTVLMTAGPALAQESSTVNVRATIIADDELSVIGIDPNFGEVYTPIGDASVECRYTLSGSDLMVSGASRSDPNPQPDRCRFAGQPKPPRFTISCAQGTEVLYSVSSGITSDAARDAGIRFSTTAVTSRSPCPSEAEITLIPIISLLINGETEALEQAIVGDFSVTVQY